MKKKVEKKKPAGKKKVEVKFKAGEEVVYKGHKEDDTWNKPEVGTVGKVTKESYLSWGGETSRRRYWVNVSFPDCDNCFLAAALAPAKKKKKVRT